MFKIIPSVILSLLLISCGLSQRSNQETEVITHEKFTVLLSKYVDEDGLVSYKGFRTDREALNAYLDLLRSTSPGSNWTKEEEIAYWINVYNAFTIDLVLDHYPLESIKDIGSSIQIPFVNTPWDIKFINIGGETHDLNNVEHGILRKQWKEPRVHFALNCASYSCPRLRNEAYEGSKLYDQLDDQARLFINDDFRNDITAESAQLSKFFDWFSGDFKNVMPLKDFINQYSDQKIGKDTEVDFKEYDWKLNDSEK
ncbi:MAG: hypothetical protein ACJA2C_000155 [Marinoscillum sp.]|jgi:hypothetical protein